MKLQTLIFCLVFSIFSFSLVLAEEENNQNIKPKYYSNKKLINEYCDFKPHYISRTQKEIESLAFGERIIKKLGDLENKYQWDKSINKNGSHIVSKGDLYIYHFEKSTGNREIYDYYRQQFTDNYLKTCTLASNLPIEKASIEYKIIQINQKYYLERTVKTIPKVKLLSSLIQSKLNQSNKEALEKVLKY